MLTPLLLLAFAPTVTRDVVYATVEDTQLRADIYQPATSPGAARPAVVLLHGGAWMVGSRREMKGAAEAMAGRGVVAFAVQYRLAPQFKWPAMLDDAQTAVRFVRAKASDYGVDPLRVGALGYSAGGQLSLFLGASETRSPRPSNYPGQSSRVRAVVNWSGPSDLTIYPNDPFVNSVIEAVTGKRRAEARAELESASPIRLVDQGDAPLFIIQGLSDTTVPPEQK